MDLPAPGQNKTQYKSKQSSEDRNPLCNTYLKKRMSIPTPFNGPIWPVLNLRGNEWSLTTDTPILMSQSHPLRHPYPVLFRLLTSSNQQLANTLQSQIWPNFFYSVPTLTASQLQVVFTIIIQFFLATHGVPKQPCHCTQPCRQHHNHFQCDRTCQKAVAFYP